MHPMFGRRHAGDPSRGYEAGPLARVLLLGVALVVLAWLGMSLHDARLVERANDLASRPHASTRAREDALAGLGRATLLDPAPADRLTAAGILEIRLGRLERARRTFERVVATEPDTV